MNLPYIDEGLRQSEKRKSSTVTDAILWISNANKLQIEYTTN